MRRIDRRQLLHRALTGAVRAGAALAAAPLLPLARAAPDGASEAAPRTSGESFLGALYDETRRTHRFREDYPGGFGAWQTAARARLRCLLGLERMASETSHHAPTVELGEVMDRGDHSLRRGSVQTEPHVRIPFWLLRPRGEGPFPLAVLPHGHDRLGPDSHAGVFRSERHRSTSLERRRDVAVQAVRRGFLAVAPAVRGLAADANLAPDTHGRHGDRDCRSHLLHALLAGRTPIGERVWDVSRLLDWALARDDVDATRVLVMGNSGGGMVTLYAAACDERIRVAVASCSFSVVASREGRIYHCDCNAVPGILEHFDLYDIAGLVAPRHFLAVNGRHDKLHSLTDIERAAAIAQRIFAAAGVPERFAHRWGPEGHRFYPDLMWPFVEEALAGR